MSEQQRRDANDLHHIGHVNVWRNETVKVLPAALMHVLLVAAVLLSTTSSVYSGDAMAPSFDVRRLSGVQAGPVASPDHVELDNDPAPIVLGRRGKPPAIFYFQRKADRAKGEFRYRIERLRNPYDSLASGLRALTDDYPVSFEVDMRTRAEERLADLPSKHLLTADINGDGNDELVVTREGGTIYVYSDRAKLFEYRIPGPAGRYYTFTVVQSGRVRLGGHEMGLLVLQRNIAIGDNELTAAQREHRDSTPPFSIIAIGPNGPAEIKLADIGHPVERIIAVGALTRSGALSELVVISHGGDSTEAMVARHGPDGSLLAPAREFYAEADAPEQLLPEDVGDPLVTVFHDPNTARLYFVTPSKEMVWIRTVDLAQILDQPPAKVHFLAAYDKGGAVLALARAGNAVYAIDAYRRFHHLPPSAETGAPAPMLTIEPASAAHRLVSVSVKLIDGEPRFLIIERREAGMRDDSVEALTAAASRYLVPEQFETCQRGKQIDMKVTSIDKMLAEKSCHESGQACPPITTIEDIKAHAPQYYDDKVKEADNGFRICLKVSLIPRTPLDSSLLATRIKGLGLYQNIDEYIAWLRNNMLTAQFHASILDMTGERLGAASVDGQVPGDEPTLLSLPKASLVSDGYAFHLVTSLTEDAGDDRQSSGYFLLRMW